MNYEMKLVFSKKADMLNVRGIITDICQDAQNKLLYDADNEFIFGSDDGDDFAKAFLLLCYSSYLKRHIIEAFWTDNNGTVSCKKELLEPVA